MTRDELVAWLLEGDPAIRWQVMRDLSGADECICSAERARVAVSGWGRQLLDHQDPDGLWGGSLYNGKWTSTTYALYLLKLLGLPPGHPQALLGCRRLIEGGLYEGREIRFSRRQAVPDLGVTALVLSVCAYFGLQHPSVPAIAEHLLERQRPDGAWWPDDSPAAAGYVFETTLLALEAFHQSGERSASGPIATGATSAAAEQGRRFLLGRGLCLEEGKPIKPGWTSFSFPPYWFYDVLNALDYFQASGAVPDPGAHNAVELVGKRRGGDGRWRLGARHPGRTFFTMEEANLPSRWVTLRALRVLSWWERAQSF